MLKAVIFDMDGVLIDSEPMHLEAELKVLKKHKIHLPEEYYNKFIGWTVLAMFEALRKEFLIDCSGEELTKEYEEILKEIVDRKGYPAVPFVLFFIRKLKEQGFALAVASSSTMREIEENTEKLGIREAFDVLVSGREVKKSKPAPDIFLLAAERLSVLPSECIVIEDACYGIMAARAANMPSIGYRNLNSGNQDLSLAQLILEGFEEADAFLVKQVYARFHGKPLEIARTEHLFLRELAQEDSKEYFTICQESDIREQLQGWTGDFQTEKEKLIAYQKKVSSFYGYGLWGIFRKGDNLLIGVCGIEQKKIQGREEIEVSYFIRTDKRKLGYATEAVEGVLQIAKEKWDIKRIVARIEKNNLASRRVAQKVGMKLEKEWIEEGKYFLLFVKKLIK